MRNCVSRNMGLTPWLMSRPKSERVMPRHCASRHWQHGGSWQWSPTSTSRSARRKASGTRAEISVACATSSMRMAPKSMSFRRSAADAAVVMQMTSASSTMLRLALSSSSLASSTWMRDITASTKPGSSTWQPRRSARRRVRQMPSRCELMRSGRPRRTTRRPHLKASSAMLSTAMLLSDVASTRPTRKRCVQSRSICTQTRVLPVPGGPCTSVRRRFSAAAMVLRCEALRRRPSLQSPPSPSGERSDLRRRLSSAACSALSFGSSAASCRRRSSAARSRSSVPSGSSRSSGSSASLASLASSSLAPSVSSAAEASRASLCRLSSRARMLMPHSSTLLPPTLVTVSSLHSGGRSSSGVVARIVRAFICRR
mmetsp:Transcript_92701/g.288550  ORF Transcript_92701/g.288550 Transcript_92701/m.288550 type:complete len:370 (-) Transcript_92701:109-1218(-)